MLVVLKITGIRPTEVRALASRSDDCRDHQHTASTLVHRLAKTRTGRPP